MKNVKPVLKIKPRIPRIEGPIPVTGASHPFCAMQYSRVPLNLRKYHYLEEEFFISGRADVYDADENDQLVLKREGLKYKTRILVRRPESRDRFSGRVYVDIMNATQRYDIEDLWHRNYLWCMENGHAYVGITAKPVNVQSLKNFDYNRYRSLNWSDGKSAVRPTVTNSSTLPGTEEGLIWDIITQTVTILRRGKCLGNYPVKNIYLTGQSQSGAYLNTYVSYFDSLVNKEYRMIDGYMNIVGALVQRSLCQEDTIGPLKLYLRHMHPCTTPYICLSSEADLTLFDLFLEKGNLLDVKIKNSNTETDKCRYYEIPGSPHTDVVCPVLSALDEIKKTGARVPVFNRKILKGMNDLPTEYFICGLLEKLHIWATEKIPPEAVNVIRRKNHMLQRDGFGNAEGGLRHPFVTVPIAEYIACNDEDPEKISGRMSFISKDRFLKTYGSTENYIRKFTEATEQFCADGWISKTDAAKMIRWAKKQVSRYR
jgi:hypothetical protein